MRVDELNLELSEREFVILNEALNSVGIDELYKISLGVTTYFIHKDEVASLAAKMEAIAVKIENGDLQIYGHI